MFLFLIHSLRFDNPDTRDKRKEENRTAVISESLDVFINNCKFNYSLSL